MTLLDFIHEHFAGICVTFLLALYFVCWTVDNLVARLCRRRRAPVESPDDSSSSPLKPPE